MTRRRVPLAGLLALVVVLTASPGLAAVDRPVTGGGRRVEPPSGTFVAPDGHTYDSAPQVVEGLGGELYYGPDFDVACGLGKRYRYSMLAMTRLTRVIERSGRRAIWTVGPDKTSVLPGSLDLERLPH